MGALYRLFQLHGNSVIDDFDVILIEQEAEAGGLARTITDKHGFSWDLGVHITGTSKYPEFLRVLQESIPEWNAVQRCVKADMSHAMDELENEKSQLPGSSQSSFNDYAKNYVPYPVQNSIPYFSKQLKQKCLEDLEQLNGGYNNDQQDNGEHNQPDFNDNFSDFSRKIFGPTLQSIFIRPYNEKVWTVKLEEMSCKWVKGRVPRIDPELIRQRSTASLQQLAFIEEQRNQTVFRYPAKCKGHSKVILVGVGLHLPQSELAQKLSWAYYPRPEVVFYRCTLLSNFSRELTPDPEKYWSVLCEIGTRPEQPVNKQDLIRQTIQGLISVGIVDKEEQVHSSWLMELPFGYPVPTLDRDEVLENCHKTFHQNDIYSRGRFGGWRYEISNQDHSFESGLQLMIAFC
uniref:Amine oxidase domain-containing protein n=1 Tax=Ditylenchus dipsaci TaxID=166011 RepID=A0A915D5P3_9BILA